MIRQEQSDFPPLNLPHAFKTFCENNDNVFRFTQHRMAMKHELKNILAAPNLWKIFSSDKISPLRRSAWVTVFLICTGLFVYETVDRVGQLLNPPKSASVKLSYKQLLRFPSVTVCPGYPLRSSGLKRLDLDEYGCQSGRSVCSWSIPWTIATHTETMIKWCRYKKRYNCNPGTEEKGKWRRVLTSIGRCFTFDTDEPVFIGGDSNGLEIIVDPMLWDKVGQAQFNGIRVYLHHSKEVPIAGVNGININQGSAAHYALLLKQFHLVNDLRDNPCEERSDYVQSKCVIRCIFNTTLKKANTTCGAPFMQRFNIRTCREKETIHSFMQVYNNVVFNGSFWRGCYQKCPNTCTHTLHTPITTSLDFEVGNASNPFVNVTIYYKDMWVEYILEQWSYSVDDFIADTGGSLTLFLGVSFYTLIQVCDYFIGTSLIKAQKLLRKFLKGNEVENNVGPLQLTW